MAQINKPNEYFNTKLYTGNNSTNAITGVGFQPDLVWIKEKSSTSSHRLIDAVRGVGKGLSSDSTGAEQVIANILTSFDNDGFTVDDDNGTNENSQTYASWNWLGANGTASNTDGSITSTVSANTTSGFSIVSYTGTGVGTSATIGHSLGVAPSMIIVKSRDSSGRGWIVYHKSLGATKKLELQTANAEATDSGAWNNTAPTSTVFSVGTGGDTNTTDNFIAYCFAEKKGFSKFGSYTGNGNADGTFVYTGFKPAFVITKSTDIAQHWQLYDNKRNEYNQSSKILFPSLSAAEQNDPNAAVIDMLSNGFKQRVNDIGGNGSGNSYIYMAFAENPLVGTNNIPATAR